MRSLFAAVLLLACSAPAAVCQASGHVGVSATVVASPGAVQVGGDVRMVADRGGASLSAGLRITGAALATVALEGAGASACRIVPADPSTVASTGAATEGLDGRDAGRLTCRLPHGGVGMERMPVTLVIVPAA
jgi:hypothetical protein